MELGLVLVVCFEVLGLQRYHQAVMSTWILSHGVEGSGTWVEEKRETAVNRHRRKPQRDRGVVIHALG
jgi:hypothetical protein